MKTFIIPVIAMTVAVASPAAVQAAQQKLTSQQCDAAWKQANPQNLEKLPLADASRFITDTKAANPDGDTTIEKNEFRAACAKGLVKTADSGHGANPPAGETSDRTPEKATPTPPNQVDSSGGATSDRTPGAH